MLKSNKPAKAAICIDKPLIDDKKCALNARFTETRVVHHFPGLLPFGMTTLSIKNSKWTIKCGSISVSGFGGEVDDIVKHFVQHANQEVLAVKWEVEKESFTTEPTVY